MKTLFLLLIEFETGEIPLEHVACKFFSHDKKKMQSWARHGKYPFPVYRGGSTQKSQWLVSAEHFAEYLDNKKHEALKQFETMHGS